MLDQFDGVHLLPILSVEIWQRNMRTLEPVKATAFSPARPRGKMAQNKEEMLAVERSVAAQHREYHLQYQSPVSPASNKLNSRDTPVACRNRLCIKDVTSRRYGRGLRIPELVDDDMIVEVELGLARSLFDEIHSYLPCVRT